MKPRDDTVFPLLMSKLNNRQRDPPPVLFQHPSPSTSHVSLVSASTPGLVPGHTSLARREQPSLERSASIRSGSVISPDFHRNGRVGSSRSTDKTDGLWAEMQATIEEVELSASGGTHVFGSGHGQKLCELRSAQIGLAQAWARSEADEGTGPRGKTISSSVGDARNVRSPPTDPAFPSAGNGTDQARDIDRLSREGREASDEGLRPSGHDLIEESEMDIVLGKKRREANDEYFRRVNDGVIDVVAKLEAVAVAMHAVEHESQHVWEAGDKAH